MSKQHRRALLFMFVGAVEITAPAFAGQPQFKSIGTPPPGPYGQKTWIVPLVCSNTGELAGGISGAAVIWNPNSGFHLLQSSAIDQAAYATDFITDLDIPVGTAQYNDWPRPVTWPNRDGPPVAISGFPAEDWYAGSPSVFANANGSMIVGNMINKKTKADAMFIWRSGQRKAQGWEFITKLPSGKAYVGFHDFSDLSDVAVGGSANASITVFEAMRWTKAMGFAFDGDLPGGDFQSGYDATNAIGTVAVGLGMPSNNQGAAVRWTARSGMIRLDESAPPPIAGYATKFFDSDHSGFVHVGGVIQEAPDAGVIWDPLDGMRSFKSVLVNDYGLPVPAAWKFYSAEVMSPNGRYIAGRGMNPAGVIETWWAEIRPFCYADCDRGSTPKGGAAVLDIDDFICFMTHFAIDDLYANCNNDADLDIDDFICFQTAFAVGC